ncbi:hypothetical protein FSP39_006548, partial [Pinctada imbricata]
QDISDYEWMVLSRWLLIISPFYIGHTALTKIVQWNFPEYKHICCLAYSLAVLFHLMGVRVVLLYLLHCAIMYAVTMLQSKAAVWITSLTLLTTLNFKIPSLWTSYVLPHDEEDRDFYLLAYTIAFMQLRYTSFCLEKVNNSKLEQIKEKEEQKRKFDEKGRCDVIQPSVDGSSGRIDHDQLYMEKPHCDTAFSEERKTQKDNRKCSKTLCQYSFQDLVFYVFYLPLFFTGPVMTFNIFQKQIDTLLLPWTKERWKSVGSIFLRSVFWAFINQLLLHYIYFGAIQQNISVMNDIDMWTLAGVGYWSGQFFMTKYFVLFCYPACWARLEGIYPPPGPKCIAYIYTYSDMWKYIFVPLGGSHTGLHWQVLSSIACFMFVFYWHGSEYYIFLWTLFNFIGIALELIAKKITDLPELQRIQMDILGPAWIRRLYALCTVPLYLLSAITAFCFFGGSMVGYIFYNRVILQGNYVILIYYDIGCIIDVS